MSMHKKSQRESTPSGKPVKPKKPAPVKEEGVKISVPCSVLTEERVREIAREEFNSETERYARERSEYINKWIIAHPEPEKWTKEEKAKSDKKLLDVLTRAYEAVVTYYNAVAENQQ